MPLPPAQSTSDTFAGTHAPTYDGLQFDCAATVVGGCVAGGDVGRGCGRVVVVVGGAVVVVVAGAVVVDATVVVVPGLVTGPALLVGVA